MPKGKRVLALCAAAVAASCWLQPSYSAQPVLTGNIAEERVQQLSTQIDWFSNLHEAEAESQKTGKLIFWLHILGHIDGAT